MMCGYGSTSKQSTLKIENAISGIPNQVHHCLPGLTLCQCFHLVSCEKGQDIESRLTREASASYSGEDSCIAHANKLCTPSHDVNVRACQIAFCSTSL